MKNLFILILLFLLKKEIKVNLMGTVGNYYVSNIRIDRSMNKNDHIVIDLDDTDTLKLKG